MNLSCKCNCCAHEKVCGKTESYKKACKAINDAAGAFEKGLVSVSIRCENFMANTAAPKKLEGKQ